MAEREEIARAQAEQELSRVRYLPGRLSWSMIEAAYLELDAAPGEPCARPPLHTHRRRGAAGPSRPAVAHRLDISTATLDRASIAAGRGKHWPPRGL